MSNLPVIENADDVFALASSVAACQTCEHLMDPKNYGFTKCGAHGGRYTSEVNGQGQCTKWQRHARDAKGSGGLIVAMIVLLIFTTAGFAASVLLRDDDEVCRPVVKSVPTTSAGSTECPHPQHELSVADDLVTCLCPKEGEPR